MTEMELKQWKKEYDERMERWNKHPPEIRLHWDLLSNRASGMIVFDEWMVPKEKWLKVPFTVSFDEIIDQAWEEGILEVDDVFSMYLADCADDYLTKLLFEDEELPDKVVDKAVVLLLDEVYRPSIPSYWKRSRNFACHIPYKMTEL